MESGLEPNPQLVAKDAEFDARVRSSFSRQQLMSLLGASLERVELGAVDISLPFRSDLTQQHGYLHAAITTAIADSACGYSALTLTPATTEVLTIEFKMNLLRPAVGTHFVAEGRILKRGKTIIVTQANVFAASDKTVRKLIAAMTGTIMCMDGSEPS
jgi:uncharacterized protein (TIGR00369 family)